MHAEIVRFWDLFSPLLSRGFRDSPSRCLRQTSGRIRRTPWRRFRQPHSRSAHPGGDPRRNGARQERSACPMRDPRSVGCGGPRSVRTGEGCCVGYSGSRSVTYGGPHGINHRHAHRVCCGGSRGVCCKDARSVCCRGSRSVCCKGAHSVCCGGSQCLRRSQSQCCCKGTGCLREGRARVCDRDGPSVAVEALRCLIQGHSQCQMPLDHIVSPAVPAHSISDGGMPGVSRQYETRSGRSQTQR